MTAKGYQLKAVVRCSSNKHAGLSANCPLAACTILCLDVVHFGLLLSCSSNPSDDGHLQCTACASLIVSTQRPIQQAKARAGPLLC